MVKSSGNNKISKDDKIKEKSWNYFQVSLAISAQNST